MDKRHLIAKRAARYFQSGDVVNLGIGIPSLCGNYAEPGVFFQAENGFIGVGATAEGLMVNERTYNAGGVPFIPVPGSSGFDVAMAFGVIRSGRLAATVLGALQVSERGDLANWSTPGRSFGMGGAMDLVNGARKVIVAMEHCTREGAPKIVKECTLPYTGRGCVDHIVTELCVIDVTKEGLLLRELAPGHTLEEVQAKTEAELSLAEDLREMVI
ncbi:3-oxoacid CoA-transferase subunit B [Intestinimonas butyriciproducens]|uniref:3-oxoacid CoA-transferase subunit B/acetate CoA/acetoacetate CoA-transferase beta subunit n=1 Tax=Intestinimonas butyriciproducens TaxID=1297617 RepID=A0A2U1BIZ1_9FIRM|nr:3-oxoacid CoA-transferase subunit B [Intestinimonas butyriciproducens]MBU5230864.1 3-oxoacid CoA-transferase subunit B [Intestinimonas butyriciproducens]MCR1906914.1 3-oxoacid CoA-transferase subunit B [Intestinimonas butyriciproducens]PVY48634.1 3-oxoacid CoA-transferase subunit B/acetate CoA/acetoacetate CoA-transferase beta subunit [Intestinimonas butyriciproducens]QBB65104.1 Butyrate-acetoacetate CoA-transferase subunit B [Intestinimonas butyriciproducens]